MRDQMAARGPDGSDSWISPDERIGFGHRRLAIIDPSERGAQPMQSADGKLIVVFNGAIYNYRALRSELEALGYAFRTQSDTEVLIHLYAARGAAMVRDLRGMFAFALWDAERRGLLLARDPFGIKPLYYADYGGILRFASQVRAILAGGALSRDSDPAGWVGFYLFGNVPEPFTTYRGVCALPAGTTVWIDVSGVGTPARYFVLSEAYRSAEADDRDLSPSTLRSRVRSALIDSLRHHLQADVPIGLFLSSGIDSCALLGLIHDIAPQPITAVTVTCEEYRHRPEDEAPLAAKCAAHYGAAHSVRVVTEQEFRVDLPRIVAAMDQPTIDGINTWFVSKAASELGLKAAISGLGGDEVFGGYPSFRDIPRWVRLAALPSRIPLLGDAFRHLADALGLAEVFGPKAAGLFKYGGSYAGAYLLRRGLFMPWELDAVMDRDLVTEGLRRLRPIAHIRAALHPRPRTSFGKIAVLEGLLYLRDRLLRDTDWASLAHSLEVRTPFVDVSLLQAVAPIMTALPNGAGKRLLAATPASPLPAEIAGRAKTGFGTPVDQWLQRDARLQGWRRTSALAAAKCPWARRWAYQVAAAA